MSQNHSSTSSSFVWRGLLGIVIIIAIAFFVPIAAPVIGLILIIGGIIFHRKSMDPSLRGLSTLYAITGLLMVIISAVLLLTQISVR